MTELPYQGKVVVITGFAPETLDLSGFPGLTPEKIRADLEAHANILRNKGADARVVLYDPNDFSSVDRLFPDEFMQTIDVFEIGAGVRTLPPFFHYFEKLINFAHERGSKHIKICFNTNPGDTVESIERWLK